MTVTGPALKLQVRDDDEVSEPYKLRRDRDVAAALRAGQHDPRPQRQPLRSPPARSPSLQRPPLGIRQHQRLQPVITHILSAHRGPRATSPLSQALKRNATHVVISKLRTGTLGEAGRVAGLPAPDRSGTRPEGRPVPGLGKRSAPDAVRPSRAARAVPPDERAQPDHGCHPGTWPRVWPRSH